MSLEGHNIIVTGAGQGIGYAVARLIVDLGGKVIVVDMQGDKVNALADSLGAGRICANRLAPAFDFGSGDASA